PGLCIAAGRGGPLPAAIVGAEIEIDELFGKIAFTPAPVYQQVFYQETGSYHSQAIMHPAGLVDLAHRRIYQRIAGFAFTPGLEKRWVVGKSQYVEISFE